MTATTTPTDYDGARNAYLDEFQISPRWPELTDQASGDPIARLVIHFVDTIVRADQDILDLGKHITHLIEHTAARVAARQHVAKRGELQRTPVEYDQACSARQVAIENLRHVAAAYRHAHPS
jgi:hypothetical protein